MEDKGSKYIDFSYPDGLAEAAKYCYPDLPEDQAAAKLMMFVGFATGN